MLEITILRNSSHNYFVSLRVIFEGFGCPNASLQAKTIHISSFFRCAYFSGQIEHPRGIMGMFSSVHDDNAYVAVNTDGIFILDVDHVVSD